MSTRACYTFIDSDNTFHVYKHHDGYPSGAAEFIKLAIAKAWKLPRFEAADFGAAFVAANKDGGGGVYLTSHYRNHGDLEYRYEIGNDGTPGDFTPIVRAYRAQAGRKWKKFFEGGFDQLIEMATGTHD